MNQISYRAVICSLLAITIAVFAEALPLSSQEPSNVQEPTDSQGPSKTDEIPNAKTNQETGSQNFKWGLEEKAHYSSRKLNPQSWNMEMLAQDLNAQDQEWPTTVPIKYLPAPVPKYSNSGGTFMAKALDFGAQKVVCTCFAYGKQDFNAHLFDPTSKPRSALIYVNVLVLTDDPSLQKRALSFVSRNHPHILSQGRISTVVGNIDWQHTALAHGENMVVVNQHFFDLNHGKTILVAPQLDGSLRFMQLESPNQIMSPDLERNLFEEHVESLQENEEVLEFFNSKTAIKTIDLGSQK